MVAGLIVWNEFFVDRVGDRWPPCQISISIKIVIKIRKNTRDTNCSHFELTISVVCLIDI